MSTTAEDLKEIEEKLMAWRRAPTWPDPGAILGCLTDIVHALRKSHPTHGRPSLDQTNWLLAPETVHVHSSNFEHLRHTSGMRVEWGNCGNSLDIIDGAGRLILRIERAER